jgi:hypothetical protein
MSLVPSAEEATDIQIVEGTLLLDQVTAQLVEV